MLWFWRGIHLRSEKLLVWAIRPGLIFWPGSSSKAVISLSQYASRHVRTSTVFKFFVHVYRRAKVFFSDGSLFCQNARIKRVFFVHVRMCTL
jgi:hypothetical protein